MEENVRFGILCMGFVAVLGVGPKAGINVARAQEGHFRLEGYRVSAGNGCGQGIERTVTDLSTMFPLRFNCAPRGATGEITSVEAIAPPFVAAANGNPQPFNVSFTIAGKVDPPPVKPPGDNRPGPPRAEYEVLLAPFGPDCPRVPYPAGGGRKSITSTDPFRVGLGSCRVAGQIISRVPDANTGSLQAQFSFTILATLSVLWGSDGGTLSVNIVPIYRFVSGAMPTGGQMPGGAGAPPGQVQPPTPNPAEFLITGLSCQGDARETGLAGRIACGGATRGGPAAAWEWLIDGRPVPVSRTPMIAEGNAPGRHVVTAVAIDAAGRRTQPYSMEINVSGAASPAIVDTGQLLIPAPPGTPNPAPLAIAPNTRAPLPDARAAKQILEARCHELRSVIAYSSAALAADSMSLDYQGKDTGLAYLFLMARTAYIRLNCDSIAGSFGQGRAREPRPGGFVDVELLSGGLTFEPQTGDLPLLIRTPVASVSSGAGSVFTVLTDGKSAFVLLKAGTVSGATTSSNWRNLTLGQIWVSSPSGFVPYAPSAPAQPQTQQPTCPEPLSCGQCLGGGIRQKWLSAGAERSRIGCPVTPELAAAPSRQGTTGRYAQFGGGDGGYIIWHSTGPKAGQAYIVDGCFFKSYHANGGTTSQLGFPLGDAFVVPGGVRQDFEGGSMTYDSATAQCSAQLTPPPPPPGACPEPLSCGQCLGGGIRQKWLALGAERSPVGCPVTPELAAAPSRQGTTGRYAQFGGGDGAYIIWHSTGPKAGQAHVIDGCLFKSYHASGGTTSVLGFPLGDAYPVQDGIRQDFEGGYMQWNSSTRQCWARPGSAGPPAPSCSGGFAGVWDGGGGLMLRLAVNGNQASGTYTDLRAWQGDAFITGTVRGNVFDGQWHNPVLRGNTRSRGPVHFELAPDGRSFQGYWREEDGQGGGGWTGSCVSDATRQGDSLASYEGAWACGGTLSAQISQRGAQLQGTYQDTSAWSGSATITGTVLGRVLEGQWYNPAYRGNTRNTGPVHFEMAPDGRSWTGYWREADGSGGGAWNCVRAAGR
jgi:hypothetical protein